MGDELVIVKGDDLTDEMIAADPERYSTWKNGAVYDHAAGHIVKAPPPEMQSINKENAREMHSLYAEKRLQRVAEGIAEGAGVDFWEVGIRDMTAAQVKMALDPARYKRASTEAYRAVLGELPKLANAGDNIDGVNVSIQVSQAAAQAIATILERAVNKDG